MTYNCGSAQIWKITIFSFPVISAILRFANSRGGGSAHVAFQPGNHRSSSKAKTEKMLFIVICGLVELGPERIRVCISTVSDILFLNLKFDLKTIFPKTQIVKNFVANNIAIYSNWRCQVSILTVVLYKERRY